MGTDDQTEYKEDRKDERLDAWEGDDDWADQFEDDEFDADVPDFDDDDWFDDEDDDDDDDWFGA